MSCLCTGRPPCWVCEARAKQDALEAGMREVQDRINRLVEKLATDDGQDHHQTHGNGPVSAEERQSGLGRRRAHRRGAPGVPHGRGEGRGMRMSEEQREELREHVALGVSKWGGLVNPGLASYEAQALLDDLDEAEQRAERAEAELAALRERVRIVADRAEAGADAWGACSHEWLPRGELRHLLDDDTTGAASGEGEK